MLLLSFDCLRCLLYAPVVVILGTCIYILFLFYIRDVANGIWSSHPQTRRRHLSFHASGVVPISPSLRLVEDAPANTTLADVYEVIACRCGWLGRTVPNTTSHLCAVCLVFTYSALHALIVFGG